LGGGVSVWQVLHLFKGLESRTVVIAPGRTTACGLHISGGMENDQRDPQTYAIIGAAMEVHRELGCGYLEPVYVEALEIELRARGIPHRREVSLPITYKGQLLKKFYRVDFICHDEVLVELKALHSLGPVDEAQLINYLCAARRARGLLLNFGTRSLQYKRRVWRYEARIAFEKPV
jgi:GxxExxY protein